MKEFVEKDIHLHSVLGSGEFFAQYAISGFGHDGEVSGGLTTLITGQRKRDGTKNKRTEKTQRCQGCFFVVVFGFATHSTEIH